MRIDILTLFPEMFTPVTESSMLGRACRNGILDIRLTDIREYTLDKHKKTDEYPFGGGAGMVMTADPVFRALEAVGAEGKRIIYMSPRGKLLDREMIEELSGEDELVILCGHYEGVDQRILDHWNMEEISIGDYILTGGELPAMVLTDSVARFIPGVLSSEDSAREESIYSGLLEYDQYTKPREYRGYTVPEVLFGGNHGEIALWKLRNSMMITREKRPDLFEEYVRRVTEGEIALGKAERKVFDEILSDDKEVLLKKRRQSSKIKA